MVMFSAPGAPGKGRSRRWMMLAKKEGWEVIEKVVVEGDLSKLTPQERVLYYRQVCESLGLNPLTRPFDYIVLNGRLTLYARRDATDQLRRAHGISVQIISREFVEALGLYVVTARATAPDGRTDEAVGAVSVKGLSGEALANAIMKAETKAKRRVTLSLVGLGWTDESEVESIPGATRMVVDAETGEILGPAANERNGGAQVASFTAQAREGEPSEKQLRAVGALCRRVGAQDHETARELVGFIVGRPVASRTELTREEASLAIDGLQALARMMESAGATEEERKELAALYAAERRLPGDVEEVRADLEGIRRFGQEAR